MTIYTHYVFRVCWSPTGVGL